MSFLLYKWFDIDQSFKMAQASFLISFALPLSLLIMLFNTDLSLNNDPLAKPITSMGTSDQNRTLFAIKRGNHSYHFSISKNEFELASLLTQFSKIQANLDDVIGLRGEAIQALCKASCHNIPISFGGNAQSYQSNNN